MSNKRMTEMHQLQVDPYEDDKPSFFERGGEIIKSMATEDEHLVTTFHPLEADPNGTDPHAPGAKLDAGKAMAGILADFARALTAIAEVGTFGAKKYSRGGWQAVPNGAERYTDAMWRHLLKEAYEPVDNDSGLAHDAHMAWNALARLELRLREKYDGLA
jgi:hypothetical protein